MAHESCKSQIAVLEMNGQSVPQRWTRVQSLETETEILMPECVCEKRLMDINELKQRRIETWSAISRVSLIK